MYVIQNRLVVLYCQKYHESRLCLCHRHMQASQHTISSLFGQESVRIKVVALIAYFHV